MCMSDVGDKYERHWQVRMEREPDEDFWRYERNWALPNLLREGENFLDLASGSSIVGEFAKKKFNCKVKALDISKTAVKEAKKRGVDARVGSVEERLPFGNGSFDTVFWGDNIEHVFAPLEVMAEARRVLVKGGRLVISTPNQAYWRYRWHMFTKGELPKTEGEDNKPWEWGHIRFFNRQILRDLFKEAGFRELDFIGVSRRRLDKPFLKIWPELFGMIMVIEVIKI